MKNQFSEVNCQYGAPMGRASFGTPEHAENKIRVFRVNLDSGGYDDGGAYWGSGLLYCATDGADYRQFVRARGRLAAIAELEIPRDKLARPPLREFRTWQILAGDNLEFLNDKGRPLFLKLCELGFAS